MSSRPQPKPQSLGQFIESQKTQYATNKGLQAANEYSVLVQPFVNRIIELEKLLKETTDKLPKKQRVKIVKKGKK